MNSNNSKGTSSNSKFEDSNTMVAKTAFLILLVVVFVYTLRLASYLLSWLFRPTLSPHLIDGMIDSTKMKQFTQDPNTTGSIPIMRSVNQSGVEFTWSVWIYIKQETFVKGKQFKHVFHKGNYNVSKVMGGVGLMKPNNGPGLYIDTGSNSDTTHDLAIVMNTYAGDVAAGGINNIQEIIKIQEIPVDKWVNVIIRCENLNMDVFINGTIVKRKQLKGVPRQNYEDVFMSANGGFDGNTSDLWYFDHALGMSDIQQLVSNGPNTKVIDETLLGALPYYLSLRWFFNGFGDQYNSGGAGGVVNAADAS
jgi:hypothetical protein